MSFSLQPTRVATGFDEEAMMVLDDEKRLVAVLVHLSDDNEVAPGQWYLEAGFGRADGVHPTFQDLDAAQQWLHQRLARASHLHGNPPFTQYRYLEGRPRCVSG